jgi:multiple sugar transport system substrate-binding protein
MSDHQELVTLSRRGLLRAVPVLAGVGAVGLLAACGGSVTGGAAASTANQTAASAAISTTASAASAVATNAVTTTATQVATTTTATQAASAISSTSASTASASSAAQAAGTGATVELIYVSDPGEQPLHLAWMKRFHELNPDITIQGTLLPEDDQLYSKLLAMVAGGTPPDLSYIHPRALAQFAAKKVIVAVDPFVAQDKTANVDDFYKTTLEYYLFGGKYYGLPYYSGPSVTYFNKTLFTNAGVTTPDVYQQQGKWTWQTLVDVSQKLTNATNKVYGYHGTGTDLHWICVAIWGNDGQVWDDQMTKMLVDQPAALEALQFEADMAAKYHIIGGDIAAGTAALSHGIRGDVPGFKDVHFDLGMAALPQGAKGLFCRNGPNCFPIYAASKHQQEAWQYANWITQQEAQAVSFNLKRSVPARQSVANSGEFEKSLYPWESAAVYRDAMAHVVGMPLPSTYIDIDNTFKTAFKTAQKGTASVSDALQSAIPKMNALLGQKVTS